MIIVSGFLILTAVNKIILKPMGNITDKLHVLSSCARAIVRFVRISKKELSLRYERAVRNKRFFSNDLILFANLIV